jgi:hypothetical protein
LRPRRCRKLLAGTPFNASDNDWDWLGHGVYFWETNPLRGLEFARELQRRKRGKTNVRDPYVVGAVIDLGFCLDLISSTGIRAVESAYFDFVDYCNTAAVPVPENTGGQDALFRKLDCAVINHLHKVRDATKLTPFDSVRVSLSRTIRSIPNRGSTERLISRFAFEASNASGVSFESRTIS